MGCPRGNFHAEENSTKRLRINGSASNGENLESVTAGQGRGDLKYPHCKYCYKNISGRVHIKCAVCCDIEVCIECFSVGAEVYPHKSGHPYRVMVSTEQEQVGNELGKPNN